MRTIELETLPIIRTAHIFGSDYFSANFTVPHDFIDVTIITEGSSTIEYYGETYTTQKDDIVCCVRDMTPFSEKWSARFEKRTVKAEMLWKAQEDNPKGLYLPLFMRRSRKHYRLPDTQSVSFQRFSNSRSGILS